MLTRLMGEFGLRYTITLQDHSAQALPYLMGRAQQKLTSIFRSCLMDHLYLIPTSKSSPVFSAKSSFLMKYFMCAD